EAAIATTEFHFGLRQQRCELNRAFRHIRAPARNGTIPTVWVGPSPSISNENPNDLKRLTLPIRPMGERRKTLAGKDLTFPKKVRAAYARNYTARFHFPGPPPSGGQGSCDGHRQQRKSCRLGHNSDTHAAQDRNCTGGDAGIVHDDGSQPGAAKLTS